MLFQLLIRELNKTTKSAAHNYIMTTTLSPAKNETRTFGVPFSYFTTQQRDRLQFSFGNELISFKSQDLLPSASHTIVNHINFSIRFT